MKLNFIASFSLENYKKFNVTKNDNILLLEYGEEYKERVRKELRKIVKKNESNLERGKPPVEIEVRLDIHYAKRSLDQNAWMWAAHTLEANIINGGLAAWNEKNIRWRKQGTVTPEEIHEDYMSLYAPRGFIEVQAGFVDMTRKMIEDSYGRVIKETEHGNSVTFEIWKTSSYMNVAEFCELAEKVEEQLLSYGIDIRDGTDFQTLLLDLEKIKKNDCKIEKTVTPEPIVEKTIIKNYQNTEEILTALDNGDTMFKDFGIF